MAWLKNLFGDSPMKRFASSSPQFGISVAVHLAVLWVLWMLVIEAQIKPKRVTVITEIQEIQEQEEFQEQVEDQELDLETPVSLTPTSGSGPASEALPSEAPTMSSQPQVAEAAVLTDRSLSRPLALGVANMGLDSMVTGLKGQTVSVGGGGDSGAIDRITLEILRQLDKNKVIVAWILDSSGSLEERRETIAKKLKRVYHELDELGVNKESALLSAVVSVGKETRFLTDKPTNDNDVIGKAIKSIKDDETGQENLFRAVRDTALKYRSYQTSGRRTLMVVVITDEIGDDLTQGDETVALCRRNRVPIYVLGPMATFGLNVIHDTWKDPQYGFTFWLPVKRGPYTREDEVTRVAFNEGRYKSGFGPFNLVQVARETGGIYFIYPDDRVRGPDYALEVLNRYRPNYGNKADYYKEVGGSPMRRKLMEVTQQANKIWRHDWPNHWLHENSWKPELESQQKQAARYLAFAQTAIPMLESVEKGYDSETIPRWQANFDLALARILKAKVRCEEYNYRLSQFKQNPQVLKNPKKNNGWHIKWIDKLATLGEVEGIPKLRGSEKNKEYAEKAKFHYQRILDKHPGTPWAEAARREIGGKVGVEFTEGKDTHHLSKEDRAKRAKVKVKKI
ncbi:hypothetical protein Pan216_54650 [Planctomycetes bacterium Pan216]|uniref:VWFA domain-containing protein n=1 Tax=Kolteria novifilia TaxID=2527975 RepID=A0A518BC60_9BACT|nr:hypothetical protein Pan216_54650 [Planctomycetes bacterium Pan216]